MASKISIGAAGHNVRCPLPFSFIFYWCLKVLCYLTSCPYDEVTKTKNWTDHFKTCGTFCKTMDVKCNVLDKFQYQ